MKLYINFVKDTDTTNKNVLNNSVLKPIDFYFEYDKTKFYNEDNINQEINEFLSCLI